MDVFSKQSISLKALFTAPFLANLNPFFSFFVMGLMSVCSFFAVCSFYVAVDLRRPPSFFLHRRSSNKNQRRKDRCLIMDFEDLSVNDDVPL